MADQETPGHAEHDPERVAALLDRELTATERREAEGWIAICGECRALLADLRALSAATAALPVPARARAFAVSPEQAADLRRVPVREPVPASGRLAGEMNLSSPGHQAHDRVLVASLVDRSIGETDRALAERQLAACGACALLHGELVALAAATRAMPVPARTRDFTLTQEDARRLRGSWLHRLVGAIGSSRDAFSRPLALGFTTLGLAGLLVATVPLPFGAGGATSAERTLQPIGASTEDNRAGAGPGDIFATQASEAPPVPEASAPAAAMTGPSAAPPGGEAAPAASPPDVAPDVLFEGGESSPLPGEPATGQDLSQPGLDGRGGLTPSPMAIVAGLLLLIGLGLFGLRWTARRLGDG